MRCRPSGAMVSAVSPAVRESQMPLLAVAVDLQIARAALDGVGDRGAAAVVERIIGDQPGLVAGQRVEVGALNLRPA